MAPPLLRSSAFPAPALNRVKNHLEQDIFRIKITYDVNVKTAIALILGLVFQLSLVVPRMATAMTDCAPMAESCECCAGLTSCPCAEEVEPTQKPLPLAPDSGQTLKAPLAKVTGTRVGLETISDTQATAFTVIAGPIAGPPIGYTGVRLSVAFCSFVI